MAHSQTAMPERQCNVILWSHGRLPDGAYKGVWGVWQHCNWINWIWGRGQNPSIQQQHGQATAFRHSPSPAGGQSSSLDTIIFSLTFQNGGQYSSGVPELASDPLPLPRAGATARPPELESCDVLATRLAAGSRRQNALRSMSRPKRQSAALKGTAPNCSDS